MGSPEMIEGNPPHQYYGLSKRLYFIANGTAESEISNPENLSALFRDYLSMTPKVDVEKRPDASTLLQHAFFKDTEPLRTLTPLIKKALNLAKSK